MENIETVREVGGRERWHHVEHFDEGIGRAPVCYRGQAVIDFVECLKSGIQQGRHASLISVLDEKQRHAHGVAVQSREIDGGAFRANKRFFHESESDYVFDVGVGRFRYRN